MPNIFRPAAAAARARGLRVVQGGGGAARVRALAARARRTGEPLSAEAEALIRKAQPRRMSLEVHGPEGYERTVTRGPGARFSPEATAAQAARGEALGRHAAQRASVYRQSRGYGQGRSQPGLLDAFERKYGWRPPSEAEARGMLSPDALDELLRGE